MIRVTSAKEPLDFHTKVRLRGERAIAEMVGKTPSTPRTGGRAFKQRSRKIVGADGQPTTVLITTEANLPAEELPSYWTEALNDLMEAYNQICAYSCFRIHPVTGARSVDHMAPKSRAWDQVYEWNNYRLCSSLLNARKNNFSDVLDPFEIEDGWFVLEMVGYQIHPAYSLSEERKKKVRATIERLKLNGPKFLASRERDVENYMERHVSFAILLEESPFIAKELTRQGLLNKNTK